MAVKVNSTTNTNLQNQISWYTTQTLHDLALSSLMMFFILAMPECFAKICCFLTLCHYTCYFLSVVCPPGYFYPTSEFMFSSFFSSHVNSSIKPYQLSRKILLLLLVQLECCVHASFLASIALLYFCLFSAPDREALQVIDELCSSQCLGLVKCLKSNRFMNKWLNK